MQRVIKMNDILLYSAIILVGLVAVFLLFWLIFKKKHVIFSSLLGVLGLFLVNFSAQITGVSLGFSLLSVGLSVILGLPGVALLLLIKLL